MDSAFVTIQSRGTLALPAEVRRRHHLDEPGAQVEVVSRPDGVIELRPHVAVPVDQRWFWSPAWQEKETQATEQVQAGQTDRFDDLDAFVADLKA